jgi:hypothetical protein
MGGGNGFYTWGKNEGDPRSERDIPDSLMMVKFPGLLMNFVKF